MGAAEREPLRLDRLLTLSLFRPLAAASPPGPEAIPILMYHSIADDPDDHLAPYYRTVTTPATFARQMAFLHAAGYRVLTLSQAVARLRQRAEQACLPEAQERTAVITFDDGFRDFHRAAFPILDRFGFRATVFVASAYIGKDFLTGRPCLQAGEIRELAWQGVEFGSHTVTHPQLKGVARQGIERELAESKACIEQIVGSEVSLFSYPYRFPEENRRFTGDLAGLLADCGYAAGVTTAIGSARPGDHALFLRRLPVNDCDDRQLFRAKLDGAYDWLHAAQLMHKKLRAALAG